MNPTYSSPRSHNNPYFTAQHPPFYTPQNKDNPSGALTNPLNKPISQFNHQPIQTSSKSYLAKTNLEHPKTTNNNSAYLKSAT